MLLIRGVEGGVIPSLAKEIDGFISNADNRKSFQFNPVDLGCQSKERAARVNENHRLSGLTESGNINHATIKEMAIKTLELGVNALKGEDNIMSKNIRCAASLILYHLNKFDSISAADKHVNDQLNSGAAFSNWDALTSV